MNSGKTFLFKLGASFAVLFTLYVTVAWLSPGYDDETANINAIEHGYTLLGLIHLFNSIDVHPPGQYILNDALWKLTGNWSAVRAFSAGLTSISIWLLWFYAAQGASRSAKIFAYVAICLNPALLLWCTSVRWYAYFVPVLTFMALLLIRNPRPPLKFWSLFFLLSITLFMIGYAALILVPAGFVAALYARKTLLRKEIRIIATLGLTSLLLAANQLLIFFTVHIKNMHGQVFGYTQAIKGLGLHMLSNQGALPISLFGLSLICANLLLFAGGLTNWRKVRIDPASGFFVVGALGLFLTQLTGKFRNLVTLSSVQGVFLTRLYESIAHTPLRIAILVLLTVGNLGSIYNIGTHQNTTKGSWNTPYRDILSDIQEKRKQLSCDSMLVATHDPVIAYYAKKAAVTVVIIGNPNWKEKVTNFKGCRATVQTFRGSLPRKENDEFNELVSQLPGKVAQSKIGPDSFAQFKRHFDPDIPDYYATVTYFNSRPQ